MGGGREGFAHVCVSETNIFFLLFKWTSFFILRRIILFSHSVIMFRIKFILIE